jgi:hypothetical protein
MEIVATVPNPAAPAATPAPVLPPSPAVPADPPSGSTASATKALDIGPSNRTFYLAFSWLLLVLYLAPMWLTLYADATTDHFNRSNNAVEFLFTYLQSPDQVLNGFHKLLLPIVLGISVFAFKDKAGWAAIALVLFLLFSFCLSIWTGILVQTQSVKSAIEGLQLNHALIASYFSRTQEVLLMYLMTLLGISAARNP